MVVVRSPLKRFGVVDVSGPSMAPTLADGDRVVVRYGAAVRPGDVVVLRHPFQQDLLVIKRAVERRPGGGWWVLGDNPFNETGDSTDYGAVPGELLLATAVLRLRPREEGQRSLRARLSWALSAVRPLRADPSASSRLRAR
ncbi:nickel-type superoxide dismutase maturation protease [Streptomyces subrutilus]|uniref:Nickel-type superoxide dismutase maturation protease n=1 Tax=Streptomyces subrutilus TaxID=36818 RepID=A0A5P2UKF0_9ACTN|nr:nickel-type superoxide dismutase maturation protease [Streptomyces subrutilus]QEU78825.1 nickel-type superoxide dismutase maturation protease [Streptomyces subrutilus]WSJ34289.1 nickel-type superoxide dismutase maturation protease [Streptomyces subrutilus]GGZ57363.1 S26 family signal peptidase [Streptomyces subrutilus]